MEQFMWYWVQPYNLTSILQHLTIWQPPPYDTFLHDQISYFKIISYDMTNKKWYDKKPSCSHKIDVINVLNEWISCHNFKKLQGEDCFICSLFKTF